MKKRGDIIYPRSIKNGQSQIFTCTFSPRPPQLTANQPLTPPSLVTPSHRIHKPTTKKQKSHPTSQTKPKTNNNHNSLIVSGRVTFLPLLKTNTN
jgi:hypothetical protein